MMINMTAWLAIFGRLLTEEGSAVGLRAAVTAASVSMVTVGIGIVFVLIAEDTYQHLDEYVRIALDAARAGRLAL